MHVLVESLEVYVAQAGLYLLYVIQNDLQVLALNTGKLAANRRGKLRRPWVFRFELLN